MIHLLVFLSAFMLDVLWAIYIKKVGQHKPMAASIATLCIYPFGGFVIRSYVHDGWYLVSATAGACIGTYVATRYIR